MFSLFPSLPRRVRLSLLALSIVSGLPALSHAAPAEEPPKKELSEAVGEELGKLRPILDAKNYDEGLAKVDALLAKAPANSYDRAVLAQMRAQIFLFKNDYSNAIEPLETALQMGDKYGYFDEKARLELVNYLSQLYAQEANTTKVPEKQRVAYSKAYLYVRRYLDQSNKTDPDKELFAAYVLYSQAQLNPDKIDLGLIKQAEVELKKGMLMAIHPKDQFYALLLAAYQQQGDYAKSADLLELLVKLFPNNKNYWQTLAATYLTLQQDVRAIVTFERAQAHGALNTPKDNFNLVGIHMNIQQYDRAIDLLEAGLHNGGIENDEKNWIYLAQCYQFVRKEPKAIEALKEASKSFPKSGNIDNLIGTYYYSLDKPEEAYKYVESSLTKGMEGKTPAQLAQANAFLAYLAFELKKLDEAAKAANKALELDPSSKDAKRLRETIQDAIKEREAFKNQKSA